MASKREGELLNDEASVDKLQKLRTLLGKRDRATEELRRSLEAHKLYAAEHLATTGELAAALGKVEAAIERLSLRLDELLLKGQQNGR